MRAPRTGDAETCVSFLGCDFIVQYDFVITSEGCREVTHQRNGDPGWPAEAPEFETTVTGLRMDIGRGKYSPLLEMPKWLSDILDEQIHDLADVRERIARQLEQV